MIFGGGLFNTPQTANPQTKCTEITKKEKFNKFYSSQLS